MKTKKYLKIASLVVVAAIFIWTFVFLYQKSQPKVKVYETIVPEIADLEKTTVATGKVEPRDEVLIKPQISGIISEVYKEAGQSIRQGEVIAKVKVIPELGTLNSAESRVRLADINARQAETDFARIEKLFNDKLISDEEYEKGEVSVKQAGIISITTKKGKELDDATRTLPARDVEFVSPLGYQTPAEFYAPAYATEKARRSMVPDYRTTLYWNPTVKLDDTGQATVEFYTSDAPADYDITIEGITQTGKIVRTVKIITE